jgi:CRP-like cAMP-binding protein
MGETRLALDDVVRRLAGVRPFAALPREALQMLAFSCVQHPLGAGERLFAAGDPAEGGFFVLEGEILLRAGGQERRAGVGAVIGESALLVETIRPAEALAARDSLLLAIPRETFRRVLPEFTEAAAQIHRAAAARAGALIAGLEAIRRRDFTAA